MKGNEQMKHVQYFPGVLLAVAFATLAHGHGTPITVGVDAGRLVVSHEPEPVDFPPHIFVEEGDEGDPFGVFPVPSGTSSVVWQVPGFTISGMNDQSSLSIELLPRTVKDSYPAEERVLWYWNPQPDHGVEPSPSTQQFHLLGTGMRSTTLAEPSGPAPPPFVLADPVAGQQGFHNHGLLSYALDNSPTAQTGAYGIFARLTSDLYEPSDAFLIVLNYGVDYAQMVPAALAINAAAVDPEGLLGDYNGNGLIDAADYSVWRDTMTDSGTVLLNDPTPDMVDESDFAYWRAHFGETLGGGTSGSAGHGGSSTAASPSQNPVPEPATWLLTAFGAMMLSRFVRA